MKTSSRLDSLAGLRPLCPCYVAVAPPVLLIVAGVSLFHAAGPHCDGAVPAGDDNQSAESLVRLIESTVKGPPSTLGRRGQTCRMTTNASFEVAVNPKAALKYGVRVADLPTLVRRFADDHPTFEARELGAVCLVRDGRRKTVRLEKVAEVRIYLREHKGHAPAKKGG